MPSEEFRMMTLLRTLGPTMEQCSHPQSTSDSPGGLPNLLKLRPHHWLVSSEPSGAPASVFFFLMAMPCNLQDLSFLTKGLNPCPQQWKKSLKFSDRQGIPQASVFCWALAMPQPGLQETD